MPESSPEKSIPLESSASGWRKQRARLLELGLRIGRWLIVLAAGFGSLAVIVHWLTSGDLESEQITAWVRSIGLIAPVTYVLAFAVLGSFVVPTTVFVFVAVTLFGKVFGFLYIVLGGFLAIMVGFSAARTLGREAVSRWLGKSASRLGRLDHRLERSGITSAMFMRLLYIPNGLINVTCGLSAMRARHFAIGSLLGHVPMMFALTFAADGIKEAVLFGRWQALFGFEVIFGGSFFACCVAAPFWGSWLVRKLRPSGQTRLALEKIGDVFPERESPNISDQ